MDQKDKKPGKFYQIFKVHKAHTAPRPIISGCGSFTQNISKFIESHLKDLVPDKTMGSHYLLPHHSKAYFRAQIIEKVSPCTPLYLTEREDYWIRKLDTKAPKGINIYD